MNRKTLDLLRVKQLGAESRPSFHNHSGAQLLREMRSWDVWRRQHPDRLEFDLVRQGLVRFPVVGVIPEKRSTDLIELAVLPSSESCGIHLPKNDKSAGGESRSSQASANGPRHGKHRGQRDNHLRPWFQVRVGQVLYKAVVDRSKAGSR